MADETTVRELSKWDLQAKKIEIGILLEKASEDKLDQVLKLLRTLKKDDNERYRQIITSYRLLSSLILFIFAP
ncbi:MAG: hypothetical protein IJB61_03250 [Bacteroides sp]|nr:hypothetical protein [Bacteroides sp.]